MSVKGMSLSEAIKKVAKGEKIVKGSRTGRWYIIDKTDRDYHSSFALTYDEVQ